MTHTNAGLHRTTCDWTPKDLSRVDHAAWVEAAQALRYDWRGWHAIQHLYADVQRRLTPSPFGADCCWRCGEPLAAGGDGYAEIAHPRDAGARVLVHAGCMLPGEEVA